MSRGIRGSRIALALSLAAVVAMGTACSSSGGGTPSGNSGSSGSSGASGASGTSGKTGGSFTVGTTAFNIAHFLPGNTGDNDIDYAIWTPLTKVDPKTGKVENAMAQSVQTTDEQHWTIKIKPGWTFQNGEPVTAQSFADSWNSTAYGPNAVAANYTFAIFKGYSALNPADGKPKTKTLSGVQVVDPTTLKVTLNEPNSQFPYLLSQTTYAPIPTEALKDLTAFDKLPIGNGPYQVQAPGITANAQQIVLKRYAKYAGTDKGHADTITIKAFQSSSTAYTSFQAGALDVTLLDSGSDLASAQSKYPNQMVKVTAPALVYLGFPSWDKRFQDPKVREAFSLAIDRTAIIKSLLQGFGQPAGGVAPGTMPGSEQNLCGYCNYDPAKAKQLLQQAGGWSGPLTLWTYEDPTNSAVLQAILNELHQNLGISKISLKTPSFSQFYPSLQKKKVDGPFLGYMGAVYPSLYTQLEQLFGQDSPSNYVAYSNPKFTAQMKQAAAAPITQSVMLAQQAARTAMSTLPLAPLYYPVDALVYSKHVSNVTPEYLGTAHLASITVD